MTYFKHPRYGWSRTHSLDRLCSEQRALQVCENNPNFHYRKGAMTDIFWSQVEQKMSRRQAYFLACQSQLIGIEPREFCINIDSRTAWEMKPPSSPN